MFLSHLECVSNTPPPHLFTPPGAKMNTRLILLCAHVPFAAALCSTWSTDPVACVQEYNVKWTDLLNDTNISYVNTMPIGNAVAGANVWTDGKDTVTLMISSQWAWNEGAQLIKVGRVDLTYAPAPAAQPFSMEMDLGTGTVRIQIGDLHVDVWMDADGNAAVVTHTSSGSTTYTVSAKLSIIRPEQTLYAGTFECRPNYTISPDVSLVSDGHQIVYHRNEQGYASQDYFQDMIDEQNLGEKAHQSQPNLMYNRTSGAAISQSANNVIITVLTEQTEKPEQYVADLKAAINLNPSKAKHDAFYAALWGKSHIQISNTTVGTKYVIQRYMQTIQARAPFPLKFNGLIFTAHKAPNVDWRDWGGRNWWQNGRLSYYNMFTSGDYDQVASFLESYHKTLPMARARTEHYYNFTGAFWAEYADAFFGTQHSLSYGCGRAGKTDPPYWWNSDIWNGYNVQGSLDLSLMTLDYWVATGDDTYVEIAAEVIEFFQNWRPNKDASGKVVMYPTQALETWQCPGYPANKTTCATNDMPTVSGLHAVVDKLLSTGYGTAAQRAGWTAYQKVLPDMPITDQLQEAQILPQTRRLNVENPQLYAVHPYRQFTAARAKERSLAPATKAYDDRHYPGDVGWNQCIMDAALLGLSAEFERMAFARASAAPAVNYRFPGFSQRFQDYQPSADELANLQNGISYAIIQQDDSADHRLLLLPAWPCAWDVDFKVHGAVGTVVTGKLLNGVLTYSVSPSSRASYVTAADCQK